MLNETIVKVQKEKNFTQVDNAVLRDETLSCKAKGLYCFLLSLPSSWTIVRKDLSKYFKDGRESVDSAFKELLEKKYIRQESFKNEAGQFQGIKYFFYEYPNMNPDFVDTVNGKPVYGISATINKDIINKDFKYLSSEQSSEKDYAVIQEMKNKIITQEQFDKLKELVDEDVIKYVNFDGTNYVISNSFVENFIELTKMKPLTWLLSELLNLNTKSSSISDSKTDLNSVSNTSSFSNSDSEVKNNSENISQKSLIQSRRGLELFENKNSTSLSTECKKSSQTPNTELSTTPVEKSVKKTRRSTQKKEKVITPSMKVKQHYLDNVRQLNESGKTQIVLPNVNNQIINSRLKKLIDEQGITPEQLNLALDLATKRDWHVYTIGYSLQKLLSENVISKLLNDPDCHAFEKKVEPVMKNIKTRPKCPKCGEDLNGFGRCTWCDE